MSSWDFDELDELENVKKGFPDASCDEVTDVTVPLDHRLRIFLVSDLHVDYKQNKEWVQQCIDNLSHEHGGVNYYDCLLLPGDLCTGAGLFEEVMRKLTQAFHLVCFCFGNHEVWTRENEAAKDSLAKLEQIHRLCKELHVYTSPVRIKSAEETIILLPLWSWYHSSWDREPDLPVELQPPMDPQQRISDFRLCKWGDLEGAPGFTFGPKGITSPHLAEHFAARNEAWIQAVLELQAEEGGEILSYSHFCPRQELILEKRFTYDQHVPKISGSDLLEEQIRRIKPTCHAFGHTHVGWDTVLEGIRYVHWPLGNVKEQKGQTMMQNLGGFLLLYDSAWAPIQFTHWAYFYDYMEPRQPGSTALAPWVSYGYVAMYPEMQSALAKCKLLSEKVDGPDGMSPFFPGGALNNNSTWWKRHGSANVRWRLPPKHLSLEAFPCEYADCLLCNFARGQGGGGKSKSSALAIRGQRPMKHGLAHGLHRKAD
ncbi:unnamed protein product [Effrenium voratum]|uniref:Calcineurin-like phosphoesterase domain-containing protein n=1 Tax=Effrenium voratum TaxID=2562239 RepID=A0AA36J389_9DINO|nr:unnamed protein product [Effrenium voratum]CAJ1443173.1 unnamed protein product [Effrenium voratum]CAJ1452603.1 unnamed protein product [Effrenium voratum]